MIKKLSPLLVCVFFAFGAFAQTIVSTSPENKKVVLEEFTGIHCVYCPQGHAIAQAIQDANPGNAFLVNIHVGSFSVPTGNEPDFRTPYGTAIANQSGLIGYPAATVNRHNFPGLEQGSSGTTAINRNNWTNAANQILGASSYVNVGVEADINVSTNELVVHVEAFYTGNSPQGTNLLNVALLQNNTLGPQTGGNMGNEYVHQHRLVDMITGQWGISLPTTTTNTFVDETYSFTIPSDYNGVPVELADMEVVAFITETHQELPSGSGCLPTYSGFAHANDIFARYALEIDDQCGFDITPSVNIQNVGSDELTSLDIDYSVNSGPVQTYTWTGSLFSLERETIELPPISYILDQVNTVEITLQDDGENSNNSVSTTFNKAIEGTNEATLLVNTDNFGNQCTWELLNSSGAVVYSGGPYGNNESNSIPLTLPGDCYSFNLYDSGGNGGGSVVLYDSNNEVMYGTNGDYGSGEVSFFSTNGFLDIGANELENISIYPNPAKTTLNIANAENSIVVIYNILGQVLYTKTNISLQEEILVSQFVKGTYFVKITNGNAVKTSKFIKN
jgi:hypothetical protein